METKEKETIKYEQQKQHTADKKRLGVTTNTSVSISDEFIQLIKGHNLSPTEIFRKGMAVTMCELGILPYANPLNWERLNQLQDYFKLEDIKETLDEIIKFSSTIYTLKESLKDDVRRQL